VAYTFSKCDLYNFVHLLALTADISSLKVEIIHLALFQVLHDPFTEHILHHPRLLHNPVSYAWRKRWWLFLVVCEYKYSATQKLFTLSQITAVICEHARKCYSETFSCRTLHKEETLELVFWWFKSFQINNILTKKQISNKKYLIKEDARVITICYFRRNIRWYWRFKKQFHKNLFGHLFQYTGMSK
jgi:hypothetical protein